MPAMFPALPARSDAELLDIRGRISHAMFDAGGAGPLCEIIALAARVIADPPGGRRPRGRRLTKGVSSSLQQVLIAPYNYNSTNPKSYISGFITSSESIYGDKRPWVHSILCIQVLMGADLALMALSHALRDRRDGPAIERDGIDPAARTVLDAGGHIATLQFLAAAAARSAGLPAPVREQLAPSAQTMRRTCWACCPRGRGSRRRCWRLEPPRSASCRHD